jgi:hypothetical protein
MRTSEAVTNAPGVPVSYGLVALVYLALLTGVSWVLVRLARAPLPELEAV